MRLVTIWAYRIGEDFLRFECVDSKHGQIANEQKRDYLTAWLATIMFWQMDTASRNIGNKQQLKNDL